MTIKTVDQQLEETKRRLGQITEEMARLAELGRVTGGVDWLKFDEWLGREVMACLKELASPTTAVDRTNFLRGNIASLELVRAQPRAILESLERLRTEAGRLQERLSKWHDRGRPELRPAVNTAQQLADPTRTP